MRGLSHKSRIAAVIKSFDKSIQKYWMQLLRDCDRAAEIFIFMLWKCNSKYEFTCTFAELAEQFGCSTATVSRTIKFLCDNGYIEQEFVTNGFKHVYQISSYAVSHMAFDQRSFIIVQHIYEGK